MRKKHLVIVVAEGAGKGVLDLEKLSKGVEKDTSGNIKLPVNTYLCRILENSSKHKLFNFVKKKNSKPLSNI